MIVYIFIMCSYYKASIKMKTLVFVEKLVEKIENCVKNWDVEQRG